MFRALTTIAAAAALAVSAAPASAGTNPPPRGWTPVHEYGHVDNLGTRSGGEVVSSDVDAKAPPTGTGSFSIDIGTSEQLVLDSAPRSVKDGSSNTVTFGE